MIGLQERLGYKSITLYQETWDTFGKEGFGEVFVITGESKQEKVKW